MFQLNESDITRVFRLVLVVLTMTDVDCPSTFPRKIGSRKTPPAPSPLRFVCFAGISAASAPRQRWRDRGEEGWWGWWQCALASTAVCLHGSVSAETGAPPVQLTNFNFNSKPTLTGARAYTYIYIYARAPHGCLPAPMLRIGKYTSVPKVV